MKRAFIIMITVFICCGILGCNKEEGEYRLINVDFISTGNPELDFSKYRYFNLSNRKDEFSDFTIKILEERGFESVNFAEAKSVLNLYIMNKEVKEDTEIPSYIKGAKKSDYIVYAIATMVDERNKFKTMKNYLWSMAGGGIVKPYPESEKRQEILTSIKKKLIKKMFDKYIPNLE